MLAREKHKKTRSKKPVFILQPATIVHNQLIINCLNAKNNLLPSCTDLATIMQPGHVFRAKPRLQVAGWCKMIFSHPATCKALNTKRLNRKVAGCKMISRFIQYILPFTPLFRRFPNLAAGHILSTGSPESSDRVLCGLSDLSS